MLKPLPGVLNTFHVHAGFHYISTETEVQPVVNLSILYLFFSPVIGPT